MKGFIFDIDGILTYQGRVYPGAIETIKLLRKKGMVLRFLTNSTLKSRRSCALKLNQVGFDIDYQEVITASYATALYLKNINAKSCWIMLDGKGMDEFRDIPQSTEYPDYIVVGDNRSRFDFDHLNKALRLIIKGAKLIGMTPELTDASLGEIELNVGSWTGMLEKASNQKAIYIGKPGIYGFEITLKTMKLDKSQVCMVGDRISTDIKGAKDFGIRSVLIQTGEYNNDLKWQHNINADWTFNSIVEFQNQLNRIICDTTCL